MTYQELIDSLVKDGVLKTPRIIEAFAAADRADFVSDEYRHEAYVNAPLPIGLGQTISQPLTVAFMIEKLQPQEGDRILEIGFGSGWQTAILAHIVGKDGAVFGVEIIPKIFQFGKQNLAKTEFIADGRIKLFEGDGTLGLPNEAPFDRIIAAASAFGLIPPAWKEQLKTGGKIVAPIDSHIDVWVKKDRDEFEEEHFPGFAFVPLVSEKDKDKFEWEHDLKKYHGSNP